jgi:hypothetical protein
MELDERYSSWTGDAGNMNHQHAAGIAYTFALNILYVARAFFDRAVSTRLCEHHDSSNGQYRPAELS